VLLAEAFDDVAGEGRARAGSAGQDRGHGDVMTEAFVYGAGVCPEVGQPVESTACAATGTVTPSAVARAWTVSTPRGPDGHAVAAGPVGDGAERGQ
jgi:hypothetical protein